MNFHHLNLVRFYEVCFVAGQGLFEMDGDAVNAGCEQLNVVFLERSGIYFSLPSPCDEDGLLFVVVKHVTLLGIHL